MKGNQKAITSLRKNDRAMIQLLPTLVIAVVLVYAFLYVGTYINGTIASELEDSFGTAATRTTHENKTVNLMGNISDSFDDSVDIVGVAVIIVIITFPLMALVGLRRLM